MKEENRNDMKERIIYCMKEGNRNCMKEGN